VDNLTCFVMSIPSDVLPWDCPVRDESTAFLPPLNAASS